MYLKLLRAVFGGYEEERGCGTGLDGELFRDFSVYNLTTGAERNVAWMGRVLSEL